MYLKINMISFLLKACYDGSSSLLLSPTGREAQGVFYSFLQFSSSSSRQFLRRRPHDFSLSHVLGVSVRISDLLSLC